MAVIPYDDVPAVAGAEKDPALTISGERVKEYYCGDARCDCATGHLVIGGVAMTVDLGTTRVDFVDERDAQIPEQEALRKSVRETLKGGAINAMREHYKTTREYGLQNHFRYIDWTPLKQNQDVAWEQINRHEGVPMFTLNVTAAKRPTDGSEPTAGPESQQVQMLLGLGDSYCVEPKCDCGRAHFKVIAAPVNQPKQYQQLGIVRYDVVSGQMGVVERSQNYDPNQIYQLVHGLMQSQPELRNLFASRYHFLRQNLTPIVTLQRRNAGEARRKPTIGRNDVCPCGSGKKYKRCHGVS